MTSHAPLHLNWPSAAAMAVVCIAVGAGSAYLVMRSPPVPSQMTEAPAAQASAGTAPPALAAKDAPLPDVVITLTDEAIKRAGIETASVETGRATDMLHLPAVVEPNAYGQVNVTPLVTGRVTRVAVELGAQVRQGQTMATVFSPELADAQTQYVSARAELDAHEKELARTGRLVEIGAASRQELERIHAEHAAQQTRVESARSRLELLGLSRKAIDGLSAGTPIDASVDVPVPISGVVTERVANVGLNVDPASKLFTVVDLSTVWILANLYEQDLARVRVGDRATVTTRAYPDRQLQGRVSYIDPQVGPGSRTAKVRVEVANPGHELRLGMLAEMQIEGSTPAPAVQIPEAAVQRIADHSFVYVAKPGAPGQFIEREVQVGPAREDRVQVVSGLATGDRVVTNGSFLLRAERERLGLRSTAGSANGRRD
jgi:RND family efflux transporter MFP subunit